MAQDLRDKYFIKNSENGSFVDVTEMFDGLRFLKVDGFLSKGKPTNVYTAKWFDTQAEDFMITSSNDTEQQPQRVGTVNWNNGTPSSATSTSVEGVGATGTVPTNATGITLFVDGVSPTTGVKLVYNSGGYAQCNSGTRIKIPVRSAGDTISLQLAANASFHIGNIHVTDTNSYTYTVSQVDAYVGYVYFVAEGGGASYFRSISVTQVAVQPRNTIIYENVDLDITFIVHSKYASTDIDVMLVHDAFIDYITGTDVWIKSSYVGNKFVHCVNNKEYKPTTVKLERGGSSWVMGTVTLHTLDCPRV